MNDLKRMFTLFIILFLFDAEALASIVKQQVRDNEVVSKNIKVTPGYVVLIQVPSDILTYVLADHNIFNCSKNIPFQNKLVCKPLITKQFSTSLVVSTEANEFLINLSISDVEKKNPMKYVFYNRKKGVQSAGAHHRKRSQYSSDMDTVLNELKYSDCRMRKSNSELDFKCLSIITFKGKQYLKFQLTNKSRETLRVASVSLVKRIYGGLTGLSVKESEVLDHDYKLSSRSLSPTEMVTGVIEKQGIGKMGVKYSLLIETDQSSNGLQVNIK